LSGIYPNCKQNKQQKSCWPDYLAAKKTGTLYQMSLCAEIDTSNTFEFFHSTQTHVLVGLPGTYRKDPDYFNLYVGNHIIGWHGSGFQAL